VADIFVKRCLFVIYESTNCTEMRKMLR